MDIIAANINDTLTLRTLAHKIWNDTYTGIISSKQIEYMLEKIYTVEALKVSIKEGEEFYLAKDQKQSIGFFSLLKITEEQFKLPKIYLSKEYQGGGRGRTMLTAAEEMVRQKGAKQLQLNVNRFNTNAKGFYEKMGFSIVQEINIPFGTFLLEDFVLEKKIN